jgi:hypothetical protein
MEVENTLANYDTATITVVKSFIVQAPARLTLPRKNLSYCRNIIDEEKCFVALTMLQNFLRQ